MSPLVKIRSERDQMSALQHLPDGIFVLLCDGHDDRCAQLPANLDCIQLMLEP